MRSSALRLLVLAVAVVGFAARTAAAAQESDPAHAKVELISEVSSIAPGQSFQLGVRFELEPHWHIYWQNPGDSGQPPSVKWGLPPGFEAGPIDWPFPERLNNGALTDYGYQGTVLLPVALRVPQHTSAGPLTFSAAVHWLVCRDVCIPEKSTLSLSLPVRNSPPVLDTHWKTLFGETKNRLPRPLPPHWRATVTSEEKRFILAIETGRQIKQAVFFPLEPLQIESSAPEEVKPFARGVRLSLVKSNELLQPIPTLNGIIVLDRRHAYTLKAPVAPGVPGGKH